MSSAGFSDIRRRFLGGIEELGHNWGWYFALGVCLIVLGVIAASSAVWTTVASMFVFGWILLFAGVTLGVMSFLTARWSGFLLSAAAAALAIMAGIMLIRAPLSGAVALTLVIAAYLLAGGVFRTIASVAMRFPNWGWAAFSGVVSIALGAILIGGWPQISLWFIGLYVGIDLIIHGLSWCMFAVSVHGLARRIGAERRERPAA